MLIVGQGAREHALYWRAEKDGHFPFIAPGNGGQPPRRRLSISPLDFCALAQFARDRHALTIVGPEQPLAAGIVNVFQREKLPIFGPSQEAARIESSKVFARELGRRVGLPQPAFSVVTDEKEAKRAIAAFEGRCAIKVDGLASGKGVFVCREAEEVESALQKIFQERAFGRASEKVLVEELLEGEEFSYFVVACGEQAIPLSVARDYKRLEEGDSGPNTGGMGSLAPHPGFSESRKAKCQEIVEKALGGLQTMGAPYSGFLYLGGMWTDRGPQVLEFNCRLGDPEAQVLLPLLESPMVEVCQELLRHRAPKVAMTSQSAVCVVLAAAGYPFSPKSGERLKGLDAVSEALLFHAGTEREEGGLVTAGGRVLSVVGLGSSLRESRDRAYAAVSKVSFEGMQYRKDIAASYLGSK